MNMMLRNALYSIFWMGRDWPVSPEFHDETTALCPELEAMDAPDVLAEMLALLAVSELRALTDDEQARLRAYNLHHNLRNAIVFLQGRPISDFGMIYHDQVHGQRATYECGCQLHSVFDHYIAQAGNEAPTRIYSGTTDLILHPHYPRHVCKDHRHMAADLAGLHRLVQAESAQVTP